MRVQATCSESVGIPSNNKYNNSIVQLMTWRYNMASRCPVVISYCNIKYMQMIRYKYKIKLAVWRRVWIYTCKSCMYIDSREKECNHNTRTLKIIILIKQKALIYIILVMYLNLNMGHIIVIGYLALKVLLHAFCLRKNPDSSVSPIWSFGIL